MLTKSSADSDGTYETNADGKGKTHSVNLSRIQMNSPQPNTAGPRGSLLASVVVSAASS